MRSVRSVFGLTRIRKTVWNPGPEQPPDLLSSERPGLPCPAVKLKRFGPGQPDILKHAVIHAGQRNVMPGGFAAGRHAPANPFEKPFQQSGLSGCPEGIAATRTIIAINF
jgi:hypothetical protein